MTARMQVAMVKATDARVVRMVLLGVALVLTALSMGGTDAVYACPTQGGSGGVCGG